MNVLVMWFGLALLIGGLCFAAASGSFSKTNGQKASVNSGQNLRLRRVAKLMVFIGTLLWLFGALLTAGTSGK